MSLKNTIIAFYLPQYHTIPENDAWWEKGFTEWTNVRRGKSLFPKHQQPKTPTLGYYDLSFNKTRQEQTDLAKSYGISAFCYWHYWFDYDKRLLEKVFDEVLESKKPNFPFCIAWANHDWTRTWRNDHKTILMKQKYPKDTSKHFKFLFKAFADSRYFRYKNKPILYIYAPLKIPNIKYFLDQLRQETYQAGFKEGLHIIAKTDSEEERELCLSLGFDATNYAYHKKITQIKKETPLFDYPKVYLYKNAMKYFIKKKPTPSNEYPSLIPNWDDTPRRGENGLVLQDSHPELFKKHLLEALELSKHKVQEDCIFFLKSWNEWGEGNYMEPDTEQGLGYLEKLQEVLV